MLVFHQQRLAAIAYGVALIELYTVHYRHPQHAPENAARPSVGPARAPTMPGAASSSASGVLSTMAPRHPARHLDGSKHDHEPDADPLTLFSIGGRHGAVHEQHQHQTAHAHKHEHTVQPPASLHGGHRDSDAAQEV
eukprot:UN0172